MRLLVKMKREACEAISMLPLSVFKIIPSIDALKLSVPSMGSCSQGFLSVIPKIYVSTDHITK